MLYYGDQRRVAAAAEAVAALEARWRRFVSRAARAGRSGREPDLTGVLVEAGILAQGLADAAFAARGEDGPDSAAEAAMAVCVALARAWVASPRRVAARFGEIDAAFSALVAVALPREIEERLPEGFAHYAVYPESYAAAARPLARRAPWVVIGVRSIGTTLAAAVAAALGADRAETVRPRGDPHDRELSLSRSLRARLLANPAASFAVVDEGPGLSGTSFVSVARELDRAGVPAERIHLFPSHRGDPGSASSAAVRERWSAAPRHVVTLDDVALGPSLELRRWVADVVPDAEHATVDDLSAGAWRRWTCRAEWPPVFAQQERRKFLLTAGGERWLAEFAGLGRAGEARFARACALAGAGLSPPAEALRRGFIVRRWVDGAPLARSGPDAGLGRAQLLSRVARYLAFRARTFPAAAGTGASLDELGRMLEVNAVELLGAGASEPVERLAAAASLHASELHAVEVDGKLEAWEWLRAPDGRLLKTDAFQHADGHDLVGSQDVLWDVAGAVVELALDPDEAQELLRRVELEGGTALSRGALGFHLAAYIAFRVARWTYALAAEADAAERERIERERARYRAALARSLRGPGPG